MAYVGEPIPIRTLLFDTDHSLVDQSLHAREAVDTTNGDGFGLGWYSDHLAEPGIYHSVEPAWSDENLNELATHMKSGLFFAHVRAATSTAIQDSNCHPFRHGRWMFVHNGALAGIDEYRRDLAFAIAPELYNDIRGTTDSELLFLLAVTYGLTDDPVGAMEQAVGKIESLAERHGIAEPVQMTVCVSNGTEIWAFRYASAGTPRSLYVSEDVPALKKLYPDDARLRLAPDDARVIVSEPLGSLPGAWKPVDPSTVVVATNEGFQMSEFRPQRPAVREPAMA